MASPQVENGFTKISNELFEAILKSNITLREIKIILTVIRFTYGFNRKEAELSLRFISNATGIKFHHISAVIKNLNSKNILFLSNSEKHKQGRKIKLNKDYDSWDIESSRKSNSSHKGNGLVPVKVTVRVPVKVTKKDMYKENINTVFSHWNSKNVIKHRKLDSTTKSKLISTLKDYSEIEIKTAIDTYSFIISNEDYYFTHKWTLKDFLQRGLEKFLDLEIAKKNYLKKGYSNNEHCIKESELGSNGDKDSFTQQLLKRN